MKTLDRIVQGIAEGKTQYVIGKALGVSEGTISRAIWAAKWLGYKVPDPHTVRAVRKGGGVYNPSANDVVPDKAKEVLLAEIEGTLTNKGMALRFGVTEQQMATIRCMLKWLK